MPGTVFGGLFRTRARSMVATDLDLDRVPEEKATDNKDELAKRRAARKKKAGRPPVAA